MIIKRRPYYQNLTNFRMSSSPTLCRQDWRPIYGRPHLTEISMAASPAVTVNRHCHKIEEIVCFSAGTTKITTTSDKPTRTSISSKSSGPAVFPTRCRSSKRETYQSTSQISSPGWGSSKHPVSTPSPSRTCRTLPSI